MRLLAAALILTAVVQSQAGRAATLPSRIRAPIAEATAFAFCRAHPTVRRQLWVRGWFVAGVQYSTYLEGGLFASRQAVPSTPTNQWDLNGRWRQYGALYTHITTQASFGPRTLTLHGQLDCATDRFTTDRDPFPPPHLRRVYGSSQHGAAGPITTWASAGGLKLTLTVPRRSYPLNALARVSLRIQNVSHHDIGYQTPGVSLPGVASPQAQVLDRSGSILFPPAMSFMPPLPGPAPALEPLHPGQSFQSRQYIVVRGARIRAAQPFTPIWEANVRRALNMLITHPITVRLTTEPAPQLALQETPAGPVVEVIPPAGVTGRPLWLNYADCGDGSSGPTFVYSFGWVGTSLRLTPECSPIHAWHLRLAWLNHPVAALDDTVPFTVVSPPRTTVTRPEVAPMGLPPSVVWRLISDAGTRRVAGRRGVTLDARVTL